MELRNIRPQVLERSAGQFLWIELEARHPTSFLRPVNFSRRVECIHLVLRHRPAPAGRWSNAFPRVNLPLGSTVHASSQVPTGVPSPFFVNLIEERGYVFVVVGRELLIPSELFRLRVVKQHVVNVSVSLRNVCMSGCPAPDNLVSEGR